MNRLRASVADLQEVNRLKDEFVAVVSHELRTPLTVISGAIKTLVRYGATVSSDDRQVLITSADRASDRLRALIEQLLTASRLEHLTIESQAIELAAVASAVAADFGPATDRLQIRVSPELPRVLGDPALVQRILSNLVDNALKYSPPDSRVSVDARAESRDVVVSVRDQGPGIPEDAQSRVFERFFQVDSSSTRSVGGVGLGLYISRSLAEQIGGSLQLESSNERGSVFALTLPIAEPSTDVTSTAERMSCARGGRRTPNAPIRSPDGPSGARQPS
ncbi:MAG: sensor histidine kinase [Actinomycetota bacterium]